MIRLAPRSGMIVINPATRRPMPADGIEVDVLDTYWIRRCNDGDVVQVVAERDAPAQVETIESPTMATSKMNRRKTAEGK